MHDAGGPAYADARIEHDRVVGIHEQRIDVELGDRVEIADELRQAHERKFDRRDIGRRPVAIAFQQARDARRGDEFARELDVERR